MDFHYTHDVQIGTIQGCGCSSTRDIPSEHLIRLVYIPSRIPKYYESQGQWTTTKHYTISLTLKDGTSTSSTISFTVTVTK